VTCRDCLEDKGILVHTVISDMLRDSGTQSVDWLRNGLSFG